MGKVRLQKREIAAEARFIHDITTRPTVVVMGRAVFWAVVVYRLILRVRGLGFGLLLILRCAHSRGCVRIHIGLRGGLRLAFTLSLIHI